MGSADAPANARFDSRDPRAVRHAIRCGAHAAHEVRVELEPVEAGRRNSLRNGHVDSGLPRAARLSAHATGTLFRPSQQIVGKKGFRGAT